MSTPPEEPRADDPYARPPQPEADGYPAGNPAPTPGGYGAPTGPPPYGAPTGTPPYGRPGGAPPRNGLGTAALVLGIVGLALSIVLIGALPGVLAIILGFVGRARARRREATNGGAALAGIITGVLAVVIAAALVALGLSLIRTEFTRYTDCMDNAQTLEQKQSCQDQFRRSIEDRFSR